MIRHWAYPFAVNMQIFDTGGLLSFLNGMLYHMPTTLEGYGVRNARIFRRFAQGLSPRKSHCVEVPLNTTQTIVNNVSCNVCPDSLRRLYDNGYRLTLKDFVISTLIYAPKELYFYHVDDPSQSLATYTTLKSSL